MAITVPNLDDLTDTTREELEAKAAQAGKDILGITPARVVEFIKLSNREHPEKDAQWHRNDVVGKFLHFWRKGRKMEALADVLWKIGKPYVEEVVDAVLATREG